MNKPERAPYFIMKNINQLKKNVVVKDQNGRKYQVKNKMQQKWRSITPTAYITNDKASRSEIIPIRQKIN